MRFSWSVTAPFLRQKKIFFWTGGTWAYQNFTIHNSYRKEEIHICLLSPLLLLIKVFLKRTNPKIRGKTRFLACRVEAGLGGGVGHTSWSRDKALRKLVAAILSLAEVVGSESTAMDSKGNKVLVCDNGTGVSSIATALQGILCI